MGKTEDAIEELVRLAKNSYRCDIKVSIDYFPDSNKAFIKIDDVVASEEILMLLFCAQYPSIVNGYPVYISKELNEKIYNLPPVGGVDN